MAAQRPSAFLAVLSASLLSPSPLRRALPPPCLPLLLSPAGIEGAVASLASCKWQTIGAPIHGLETSWGPLRSSLAPPPPPAPRWRRRGLEIAVFEWGGGCLSQASPQSPGRSNDNRHSVLPHSSPLAPPAQALCALSADRPRACPARHTMASAHPPVRRASHAKSRGAV